MDKVPAVPKVQRVPRRLRDIRGPSQEATDFTEGQYGILVSGNGRRADRGEHSRGWDGSSLFPAGRDTGSSASVSLRCPTLSLHRLWAGGTCTGATSR